MSNLSKQELEVCGADTPPVIPEEVKQLKNQILFLLLGSVRQSFSLLAMLGPIPMWILSCGDLLRII